MPLNNVELKGTIDHVGKKLIQSGFDTDCITNVTDFKSVVKRLKVRKSDGDYCLASDDCLLHISWLLSTIVIHGCLPDIFTANTIVPISKGHGVNMSDSE